MAVPMPIGLPLAVDANCFLTYMYVHLHLYLPIHSCIRQRYSAISERHLNRHDRLPPVLSVTTKHEADAGHPKKYDY